MNLCRNTHFAIALHVLVALALNEGKAVSSSRLAGSVGTNPAFLRHILGRCRRAGLIATKLGTGGGTRLTRPPAEITLLEVYRVIEGETSLLTHEPSDSPCIVAKQLPEMLSDLSKRIDSAVATELEGTTIAEMAEAIELPPVS